MASVFYKYGHKKRYPVTYLFLELLSKTAENSDYADARVIDIIVLVLAALNVKDPSDEMIVQIAEDIKAAEERAQSKMGGKKPGSKQRAFGTEMVKWFGKLDMEDTLLLIADYDYDMAQKLYCEVPAEAVDRMIDIRMGYEWTKAEAQFEAVLFGMGGKIKGGTSDKDNSFEAPKTDADKASRNAALKKLGFM